MIKLIILELTFQYLLMVVMHITSMKRFIFILFVSFLQMINRLPLRFDF